MSYYLHPTNLTPKGKMSKNWPMTEAMDQDERTMNPWIHEEDKEIMTSDGTHGYEYPPQHYPTAMDQMADNDQVLDNRSSVASNNKQNNDAPFGSFSIEQNGLIPFGNAGHRSER